MQICVKDKKGNITSLPAREAHELVAKGGAVYVRRSVLKAAEVGIDEETALNTPWPKLSRMIQKARAPKKNQQDDESDQEE